MEVGMVRSVNIDQEMQQAYLDYAMSVIVARALPDARDGLKPVHRRILYAMYDMGLRPDTPFKKSARIVGEVLGKYHPHGDMAVYETMARMAQDFSMRCLLVEGQGNFGSIDGDPPAAMRYTEARLASPAIEMLDDLRKNTVDFLDNFDGSLVEPVVLPAALPNLLVNGATGIAVGMSTNIPPHNLGEVVDALIFMLENWHKLDDINIEDLMKFIKGPDFPTGGLILQSEAEDDELKAAYGSGRGKVIVQARAHSEEMDRGRNRIIITELPFMTNKSSLMERIAELVREMKVEGITDLRDESDRHGLRIVIELTKNVEPEDVLQNLYKNTPMRSTFGIIMLALVDGEPRLLTLKQALRVYLEHRLTIIRRRSEFELERAQQRAHILEGLRIALRNLDAVITLIRNSPDADTARDRLMKRYKLSEIQALAILDMPLRRLASLERKKIEEEYKAILLEIKGLQALLKSPQKMRQAVAEGLIKIKDTYNDRRRTQLIHVSKDSKGLLPMLATDLIPEKRVWVTVMAEGLVSRSLDDRPPRTSGNSAPRWSIQASNRDTLYLVSQNGEAAAVPVHALPETENPTDGVIFNKVSPLQEREHLAAIIALPPKEERPEGWFVVTATRQGQIKKSATSDLPGPSAKSFTMVKVNEEDQLGWVALSNGLSDILLGTADGMAIRFSEDEVRPMGLVAAGVGGIKLGARDEIIGMEVISEPAEILLVTSDGRSKRVNFDQFPKQGRYGQGVISWKLPRTEQLVGMACGKPPSQVTLHLEKLAPKSLRFEDSPLQTRAASGKRVIDLKPGDRILYLTILPGLPDSTPAKPSRKAAQRTMQKTEGEMAKPAQTRTKKSTSVLAKEIVSTKVQPRRKPKAPAAEAAPQPKPRRAATKPSASEPIVRTRRTTSQSSTKTVTGRQITLFPESPADKPTRTRVPAGQSKTSKASKPPAKKSTIKKGETTSRPSSRSTTKVKIGQDQPIAGRSPTGQTTTVRPTRAKPPKNQPTTAKSNTNRPTKGRITKKTTEK
jgi:DNA gyrase subunit A